MCCTAVMRGCQHRSFYQAKLDLTARFSTMLMRCAKNFSDAQEQATMCNQATSCSNGLDHIGLCSTSKVKTLCVFTVQFQWKQSVLLELFPQLQLVQLSCGSVWHLLHKDNVIWHPPLGNLALHHQLSHCHTHVDTMCQIHHSSVCTCALM